MIVLDSFAVLALLKDEPAAPQVQQIVESVEDVALTALGVSEVLDHLVRLVGADEDEAVLAVAQLGLASRPRSRLEWPFKPDYSMPVTITARIEP